ncbi:riboflavin kinase [Thermovibrio ammonificans]
MERAQQSKSQKSCCLVGKFSALHRGHRKLIEEARKRCSDVKLVTVKRGEQLFSGEEREELLKELRVESVELPFEHIKELSPEEFLKLLKEMGCSVLVVGKEWRFGKGRSGTAETAKKLGRKLGIEVVTVEPVKEGESKISTSEIVKLLREGSIEEANRLLGFNYFTVGTVERGKGLGRRLGFPTLNVKVKELPLPYGVYAVNLVIEGRKLPAVANYGVRPTVERDSKPVLEVHVPKAHLPQLYGKRVRVEFLKFLRPEKRFSTVEELKNQIKLDLKKFQTVLEERVGREQEV